MTKRGEIVELGRHRIMCGDCTKQGDVDKLIQNTEIDLILTDPPYCSTGLGTPAYDYRNKRRLVGRDVLSARGYKRLISNMLNTVKAKAGYFFCDFKMWVELNDLIEDAGYTVRTMIVWNKKSIGLGYGWRTQHELIMCVASQSGLWKAKGPCKGNVIDLKRQPNKYHPTQKPVELLDNLLQVSPFANTVYDGFLGSGSTLLACENQGISCYGMEIEPMHIQTTIDRWNDKGMF